MFLFQVQARMPKKATGGHQLVKRLMDRVCGQPCIANGKITAAAHRCRDGGPEALRHAEAAGPSSFSHVIV
jgi:hypothetical protein